MTFSLKTLLVAVTTAAVFLALYLAFGPVCFAGAFFALVGHAGISSHKEENSTPFWQCIVSGALLLFLLPPLGHTVFDNTETILIVFLFTLGLFLAYRSIRNGLPTTRILGVLIALPYLTFVFLLFYRASDDWANIAEYWLKW